MGYKKVSQKLTSRIVPRYESGLSPSEVAEAIGCHVETVYGALHHAGVKLNRRNRKKFEIKEISYWDIDPIWAAEFRGFFYGDGCAMMSRARRKDYYVYRPKLAITLRRDNTPLLENIRDHLGGSIFTFDGYKNSAGYLCNPTARWSTGNYANILAITGDILLDGPRMPACKIADVELLREAILTRLDMPYVIDNEDRSVLETYYLRLKEIKRY